MEENKKLEDVNLSVLLSKEEIEKISRKVVEDVLYSQAGGNIPPEPFRSAENRENPEVQEGRKFLKAIVYNKPELFPERYKNFLNETVGSAGGYLVPQQWYNKIMSLVTDGGVVRKNATVMNMTRRDLVIPTLEQLPSFSFVTEGTMKPVSNPGFGQVVLSRKDGGFIVVFSRQLLEDEAFDVMGFVSGIAAQIISRTEDLAGFKGILPFIKGVYDSSVNTKKVEISGITFADLKYKSIIEMVSAIPSETLGNAKWYMHRSVYGFIKSLTYESGEFVLTPDERKSNTLEGYPVVLTDQSYAMTESAPGRGFIAFGDLKYMILGTRNSLTIDFSKDATVDMGGGTTVNLWQNGLVGLNFGTSFDIKFSFPSAIAVAKTQDN
ncbi:MAG: phage major capsid protein [Ignavibacteria bacterium]